MIDSETPPRRKEPLDLTAGGRSGQDRTGQATTSLSTNASFMSSASSPFSLSLPIQVAAGAINVSFIGSIKSYITDPVTVWMKIELGFLKEIDVWTSVIYTLLYNSLNCYVNIIIGKLIL